MRPLSPSSGRAGVVRIIQGDQAALHDFVWLYALSDRLYLGSQSRHGVNELLLCLPAEPRLRERDSLCTPSYFSCFCSCDCSFFKKNFRNLVLKFEVFDSDSSTAVPLSVGLFFFFFLCNAFPVRARQLIYGTMQGRALVKHVFSTVTYHNRFPSYHDVSIFSDF
jgi:hypothetical protein